MMDTLISQGITSLFPSLGICRSLIVRGGVPKSRQNFTAICLLTLVIVFLTPPTTAQRPSTSSNPYSKNFAVCSSDKDCDTYQTFLRCHERKCQCSAINHFDEELNKCLIRVGGVCTAKSKEQYCVAYANCETRGKIGNTGECKCRSKFRRTIDDLCVSGAESSYRHHNIFGGNSGFLLLGLPVAVTVMQFIGGGARIKFTWLCTKNEC